MTYSTSDRQNYRSSNHREDFVLKQQDFPPLLPVQDSKMTEMASAIKQMQGCLEYLLQRSNTFSNQVPCYPPETVLAEQPKSIPGYPQATTFKEHPYTFPPFSTTAAKK